MSASKAPAKQRGIAYLRCSTAQQDESLPSQLDWVIRRAAELNVAFLPTQRELAEALGEGASEIGDLYLDSAVTGADMNRPGFLAFHKRAVSDSSLTHVFFWARDRFARPTEVESAMKLEKDILFSNKDVVVASGRSLHARTHGQHTFADDVTLLLEYATAHAFRVDLAYKVLRGQGKNAKAGLWNGGRAPYGMRRAIMFDNGEKLDFLRDGEQRKGPGMHVVMVPGETDDDLDKLAVVREIHDLYLRDHGLPKIAKILNARNIPSPDHGRSRTSKVTKVTRKVSGRWTVSNLRGVVEQPLYMGLYAWGRRGEGDLLRFENSASQSSRELLPSEKPAGTTKAKKVVKRDRATWFTAKLARPFDPIVPADIWHQNNDKLRRRGEVGGQRGVARCRDANKYPLRVLCGTCGQPMSGAPKYGRPVYICSTYSNSHGEDCAHNWCDRDIVLGFALRGIEHVLKEERNSERLRDLVHEQLASHAASARPSDKLIATQEARLKELDVVRHKLHREMMLAEDPIARADAEVTYKECKLETERVAAELKALRRQAGRVAPSDAATETKAVMKLLDEIGAIVQEADPGTLREVFHSLGAAVVIRYEPGRVGKRLNLPVSAELRLGSPLGELGDVGRGERI